LTPSGRDEAIVVHAVFLMSLGLLVVWGLWSAIRPNAIFVVRIDDGVPRVVRGQVTRAFAQEVGEVCRRHEIRRGEVRGRAEGHRIVLDFSRNIPNSCRQQLRNLWNLSGWSAESRRPSA
jgi:Protein of unknown function (DUF3634)